MATPQPKARRSIFRESAMRQYLQQRERDILPQIVSPPVFAVTWLLLALLMLAGLIAWSAEVPTFITASGVVLQPQAQQAADEAQAVVFFPTADASKLRAGQPVQMQIGTTGPQINTTVASVDSAPISPSDARKKFALDNGSSQLITEPSVAVTVKLGKAISPTQFAGSIVKAQIQAGSQQVLSLLL